VFCSTAFNIYRPLWPFAGPRGVATNPTLVAEPHKKFGAASIETVERLRLLKAFLKLAPQAAIETIELIERLASDPAGFRSPVIPTSVAPDNSRRSTDRGQGAMSDFCFG